MGMGLIDEPISWLGTTTWAMPAVMSVVIWKGFPFFAIAYLAGHAGDPVRAVRGGRGRRRQRLAAVPLHHDARACATSCSITCMLSLIWTANTFDLVFIMTRGGPSNATEVFTMLIYEQGIRNGRIGEASTAAMMAMPVFAGLIVILTRYLQDSDEERA